MPAAAWSLPRMFHDASADCPVYQNEPRLAVWASSARVMNPPGYYRFDTMLTKALMQGVEVSLVGQNLLEPQHKEFGGFLYQEPVEVGRSVYANVTVRF